MQWRRGNGDENLDGMDDGVVVCVLDLADQRKVEGTEDGKLEIRGWGEKD